MSHERPEAGVHLRRVRSFVTRAGRISNAQQRALDTLSPHYGIEFATAPLSLELAFGRVAPTILEIGFGMGDATAHLAALRPDLNFLGIEVHTPGVGSLLKQIGEAGLTNVRIIAHDAVEVLESMIEPAALAGLHIYFPDPWPKARHHKRRLIQGPLVALAASRLVPGGYLHCATDWQPYAEQILEVLSSEPLLGNASSTYASPANPLIERPATKFEARGRRLGHEVFDLVFVRRS